MGNINLIPNDYRQDLGLKRLVRHFIIACIVVFAGIAMAKVLISYLTWRENTQITQLEQLVKLSQETKNKTEEFRQQKQITEQQLAALSALRGSDRILHLLQAIEKAHTESVWFDSLHFTRLGHTDTPENASITDNAQISPETNTSTISEPVEVKSNVEIVGHALSHSVLAEFMRNLGEATSVADLQLIDTSTRNYTTMQVIDFNLALKINNTTAQVQP